SKLLAGRGFGRSFARRETQRERRPAPELAFDANRAVELFDNALGDRQAEAETAALCRDVVVEDFRQPIGLDARSGVGNLDLDPGSHPLGRDPHFTARLRGLNRVGDEVAVDAREREAIAFDDERPCAVLRVDANAIPLALRAQRLDNLRDGAVDLHWEALD